MRARPPNGILNRLHYRPEPSSTARGSQAILLESLHLQVSRWIILNMPRAKKPTSGPFKAADGEGFRSKAAARSHDRSIARKEAAVAGTPTGIAANPAKKPVSHRRKPAAAAQQQPTMDALSRLKSLNSVVAQAISQGENRLKAIDIERSALEGELSRYREMIGHGATRETVSQAPPPMTHGAGG